jgi:hypothetical protein
MVRFILRGPNAEARARMLHKETQKIITDEKLNGKATVAVTLHDFRAWHVLYNGTDMRNLLQKLNTADAVVDVDPIDVL